MLIKVKLLDMLRAYFGKFTINISISLCIGSIRLLDRSVIKGLIYDTTLV